MQDGLLNCVASTNGGQSVVNTPISSHAEACLYLIASTIPWAAPALTASAGGSALLLRCQQVFIDFCSKQSSSYDINGVNAIFHEFVIPSDEEGNPLVRSTVSVGPSVTGSSCWDTLWEACNIAADIISQGSAFTPPASLFMPMLHLSMLDIVKSSVPTTLPSNVAGDFVAALSSSTMLENHQIRWLRPRFAIFDQDTNDDVAALCSSTSSFERYLAVGYYTDILYNFEPFLRSDGTRVGSTELLLSHLLSVSKLYDSNIRMEYVLVEFIFQMICAVPAHDSYNAGYYRILLELCKKYASYPIVIAQGMSLLYQMLPEMDTIVVMELGRWLAFHLSNTLLSWPYWAHWASEIANDDGTDLTNHRLFIAIVIDKCCRVGIPSKVQETLPVVFHGCISGTDPYPKSVLFANAASELGGIAATLKNMIINRATDDVIYAYINECNPTIDITADDGDNSGLMGNWKIRVLLHAIFECSGIILSNMTNLLELYSASICELVADNEDNSGVEGKRYLFLTLFILITHSLTHSKVLDHWLLSTR